jgi:hypothetical protein
MLGRLRRLIESRNILEEFDTTSAAKIDEVCAELANGAELLTLVKKDLDYIFAKAR